MYIYIFFLRVNISQVMLVLILAEELRSQLRSVLKTDRTDIIMESTSKCLFLAA